MSPTSCQTAPPRVREGRLYADRPFDARGLHGLVDGPLAALGGHPGDVLGRILDVAGLAVDTVLGVDLQSGSVSLVADDLVDAGRAVALLRRVIEGKIYLDGDVRVLQPQVTGLILLVVGVGEENRGETVEGEHPVGLGIVDGPAIGGSLELEVIRRQAQGPGRL